MHSAATLRPQPHRACGACGSAANTVCHHQRFIVPEGYPLPSAYDVVVCRRCGFVYADPAATQDDYDRFYCEWSKYDDLATATGSGVSPYDAARLSTVAADLARALPSRAASILDAGCATGGLLSALREQGFTAVAGLDPSPRCAAACRERGFEAYVGSISSAATPTHLPKFDCVVFSHVLEHIYDIPAFFNSARGLLAPGGYLYLETPDATRYDEYLYAPFQEFNTEHINHFSAHAIENVARHFGFRAILVEQKVMRTSEDTLYPALFGVFRDDGEAVNGQANEQAIACDQELPSKIADYIRRSAQQMERINQHLARQVANVNRVILWGAGQLAMKLLALPCLAQTRIRALVDNNPILRGKTLAGAPIVGPQQIIGTTEPIIIATLLHAGEISAQIRRLGLTNPILSLLPESAAALASKARSGVRPS
ncbi:MAG TPA: class I SAM-dependent methyltransferase [Terriglobales bacterium]|jgi:SAM-dependent methyltransferase|nr:class I SAM-dependent methyltransferase [Terriglobales bacterium]